MNNDIRIPLTYIYAKEIKEYCPELIIFIVDYMFDKDMSLLLSIKLKVHSSLKYQIGFKCLSFLRLTILINAVIFYTYNLTDFVVFFSLGTCLAILIPTIWTVTVTFPPRNLCLQLED